MQNAVANPNEGTVARLKQPLPCGDAKRRVVLISEIISPYRIPVFNALAKNKGLELHVIFLAETDAALRQWRIYKDEICFSYQILPSWRLRAGNYKLLVNWGLRAALGRFQPDAIVCGGYNYPASWIALSWASHHRVDLILWSESNVGDARSNSKWLKLFKSRFVAKCNGFVVPGRSASDYLRTLGAINNISIAPNAIDNEYFAARAAQILDRPDDFRTKWQLPPRFLLFVGRLVSEKGTFDLLRAYAKLDRNLRSKVGLVFAGDGPCRKQLERDAAGVEGAIRFIGFVQREELPGLYAISDALVLPTHSDPWGLVVNEAMACGTPAIVTDVAGCARDLIEHGQNGYIVQKCNPDELHSVINEYLSTPEKRQQLGLRGLETIRGYSPEACAEGIAASVTSGVEAA